MKYKKLFGTDGIRAKVNEYPMTPNLILQVGQALGIHLKRTSKDPSPTVIIGKDTRISGYILEQALSSGLCSVGVNTCLVGPLPTPGIAFLTKKRKATAGVVISASHNHYEDNGIKIFSGNGIKLSEKTQDEIEELIYKNQIELMLPTGSPLGSCTRLEEANDDYSQYLQSQVPQELPWNKISLALDCAHGSAYKVGPQAFQSMGMALHTINNSPNGTNINHKCGSLHPEAIREVVLSKKLSIGIALDGDADRVILIDEKGDILDGDDILSILSESLMAKGELTNNKIVTTIMSNLGLEEALIKKGFEVLRTSVGDRHVMEEMIKQDSSLGGEPSGHIILKKTSTTGDGLLIALKVIETMLTTGLPLSSLRKNYTKYPQIISSTKVPEKVPLSYLSNFQKSLSQYEKGLGDSGRILVRYSGTEKKIRVMAEGKDKKQLEQTVSLLTQEALKEINLYMKASRPQKEATL